MYGCRLCTAISSTLFVFASAQRGQADADSHLKGTRAKDNNQPLKQSEIRSRVKVEVDILGSLSLIVRTISVDVKQH